VIKIIQIFSPPFRGGQRGGYNTGECKSPLSLADFGALLHRFRGQYFILVSSILCLWAAVRLCPVLMGTTVARKQ